MFCAKINNLLDFVMNMVKICTSEVGDKSPCLRQKSKQSKLNNLDKTIISYSPCGSRNLNKSYCNDSDFIATASTRSRSSWGPRLGLVR